METTNDEAAALALGAMAWVVGEPDRAERFLGLTGTTPEQLRAGTGSPRFLAQVVAHLEAHEPDLLACADALAVAPDTLVAARRTLARA